MNRQQLRDYIYENYGLSPEDFDDDTGLFSTSILDSFNMVEMVAFIEKTASIRFGTLDLHMGNLDSIDAMMKFVDSKTSGAGT